MRLPKFAHGSWFALALALVTCAPGPTPNLAVALKGIEKSRFLACSGPPLLNYPQGGQDRLAFMTDLNRGQSIGIGGAPGPGPAACSVTALFENSRLVQASFGGDPAMCQAVFYPCLPK